MITNASSPNLFVGQLFGPPQLSASQRMATQEILSEYDSENLSKSDIKSINDAFVAKGIRPSADLKAKLKLQALILKFSNLLRHPNLGVVVPEVRGRGQVVCLHLTYKFFVKLWFFKYNKYTKNLVCHFFYLA